MKLLSVKVRNFRCWEDFEWPFEQPVTWFLGPNAVGKSSILRAVLWCLTGVCPGTDAAGKGAEGLVRLGAKPEEMSVTVTVERDGAKETFTRTLGDGPRSKAGMDIAKRLGGPPDAVMVCLAWDAFIEMPGPEARKMLLMLLELDVSEEAVKGLLGEDYAEVAQFALTSPEAVATAYQYVYTERTGEARMLKTMAPPDLTEFPEDMRAASAADAQGDLVEMEDLLSSLEEQRTVALVDAGRAEGMTEDRKEMLVKALDGLVEQLDALKAARKAMGKIVSLDTLNKKLAAARGELANAQEEYGEAAGKLFEEQARLGAYRLAHQALSTAKDKTKCPTCAAPATKEKLTKLASEALKKVMEWEGIVAKMTTQLDDMKPTSLQVKLAEIEKQIAQVTMVSQRADDIDSQIASIERRIKGMEGDIEGLPSAEEDAEAVLPLQIDPDVLKKLDARIAQGRTMIATTKRYIERKRAHDTFAGNRTRSQSRHARLDRLVTALAPSGPIVTAIVAPAITPFLATINVALAPFGYEARLELEPFAIEVSRMEDAERAWVPWRGLSDSEKVRLGMAVQVGFALSTGLGVIVADETSRLDAEGRFQIMVAVDDAIKAGLSQAVLAGSLSVPVKMFVKPEREGWDFALIA